MSQFYQTLKTTAEKRATHDAIIEGETRWTYSQFLQQVDQATLAFQTQGITPGERVGLMLFNQKEFLVCFFALRKMGAIVVPINIQMLPQDIAYVIQNAGMRQLVIADSFYPLLKQMPLNFIVVGETQEGGLSYEQFLNTAEGAAQEVAQDPDQLAFLIYTSGTTGYPKGVMLSENNVTSNMAGFREVIHFYETDRMVLALPLFHAYGLVVSLTCLMVGGAITLVPKFHPKKIVEALVSEKATILPLVPTLFTVILDLISKTGAVDHELRFSVSGGAALPAPLLEKIEAVFHAPVIEGYGLTETAPVLAVNDPEIGSIPSCVGKPLPNVQIKIVSKDNTDCVTGEVGEVLAKGPNIMLGYYNLPEETQAAMTPDGWFRTGDLGHLDAEGRLYISGGRKKDLIIKAGENISPVPIETVLYAMEGIREAAVIGLPHEKLGEEIVACVALHEGQALSPQDIIRHCRALLAPAHLPGEVIILEELPKNPGGKVVKKLLREQLTHREGVTH